MYIIRDGGEAYAHIKRFFRRHSYVLENTPIAYRVWDVKKHLGAGKFSFSICLLSLWFFSTFNFVNILHSSLAAVNRIVGMVIKRSKSTASHLVSALSILSEFAPQNTIDEFKTLGISCLHSSANNLNHVFQVDFNHI